MPEGIVVNFKMDTADIYIALARTTKGLQSQTFCSFVNKLVKNCIQARFHYTSIAIVTQAKQSLILPDRFYLQLFSEDSWQENHLIFPL